MMAAVVTSRPCEVAVIWRSRMGAAPIMIIGRQNRHSRRRVQGVGRDGER
jgi:hypothetical protein